MTVVVVAHSYRLILFDKLQSAANNKQDAENFRVLCIFS